MKLLTHIFTLYFEQIGLLQKISTPPSPEKSHSGSKVRSQMIPT